MKTLASMKCVACKGGMPPLKGNEIQYFLRHIKGWIVVKQHHIEKEYKFPDFKSTLRFVNKIGKIAEKEGHHPNIDFTYGKAKITLYTHKINGLHENDFIVAAKIDSLL